MEKMQEGIIENPVSVKVYTDGDMDAVTHNYRTTEKELRNKLEVANSISGERQRRLMKSDVKIKNLEGQLHNSSRIIESNETLLATQRSALNVVEQNLASKTLSLKDADAVIERLNSEKEYGTITVHGKAHTANEIKALYDRISTTKTELGQVKVALSITTKNLEGERARSAVLDPRIAVAEARAEVLQGVVDDFVERICLMPLHIKDD